MKCDRTKYLSLTVISEQYIFSPQHMAISYFLCNDTLFQSEVNLTPFSWYPDQANYIALFRQNNLPGA